MEPHDRREYPRRIAWDRGRAARHASQKVRPHYQPLVDWRTPGLGGRRRLLGTKFAVLAISEGLRLENPNVLVTVISPGVVESELADTISDESARAAMKEFRKVALTPDAIGRTVLYAIEQPPDVGVNEIIVRPTSGAQ
jgi:NAD(P)-dependent dehydrogenase (short-subunit alcohol dehydrogenase family)